LMGSNTQDGIVFPPADMARPGLQRKDLSIAPYCR
jgi:hypothetical protein